MTATLSLLSVFADNEKPLLPELHTEKTYAENPQAVIPILLLLAGGVGAFYYFKVYKTKQSSKPKKAAYDENEEYEDEPDEVMVNEDNEDE